MEKTKIYIYGASGHGLVVADIARAVGYKDIIFLDDSSDNKFNPKLTKADIFIAVGDNKTRKMLTKRVKDAGFEVVNLLHPSAYISQSALLSSGIVVMPNATINAKAIIKDGVIINSGSIVEHECIVDEFCHISPNVAIAGNVTIGALTHVGIGSSIIQNVKIGKNCIIGAGSVVIKDILDNTKAYGVPARAKD